MSQLFRYLYKDTDLYKVKNDVTDQVLPDYTEKVLVLISGELTKPNKELLKNILTAINIEIEDVKLIVIQALPDVEFIPSVNHKIIISFGAHKIVDSPLLEGKVDFSIVEIGSNKILLSCNLDELEKDREMKVKLWGIMKENFVN